MDEASITRNVARRSKSDVCKKCGGKLTLTGTKMNPQTGHHHYDHRATGEQAHAREGEDEIVECKNCGWTWWMHHA